MSGGNGTTINTLNQRIHHNTETGNLNSHGEQLFHGTITLPGEDPTPIGTVVLQVVGRNPGGLDPNTGSFVIKSNTATGGLVGLHGHGEYSADAHQRLVYTAWLHWED